ncbi:MAG: cation:proton antiporter [Caldilineaceae bacterium]|nr:cation:proton antiporter [Caldilineaceae bacterium]
MERVVFDLLLICLAALAAGLLAQRLNLPMLVGYVVAGILIGPYTGGPTVTAFARIEGLAEVGLSPLCWRRASRPLPLRSRWLHRQCAAMFWPMPR